MCFQSFQGLGFLGFRVLGLKFFRVCIGLACLGSQVVGFRFFEIPDTGVSQNQGVPFWYYTCSVRSQVFFWVH